jgi:hypothetical protein
VVLAIDEPEVVTKVELGQPPQIVQRLVLVVAGPIEVSVQGAAGGRDAGEHAGAALEHPFRCVGIGEDPAQEPVVVGLPNQVSGLAGGVGVVGALRGGLDRRLDSAGVGIAQVGHGSGLLAHRSSSAIEMVTKRLT